MIDGIQIRTLDVNPNTQGHLIERFRNDWDQIDPTPQMAYTRTTYPNEITDWQRHPEGQVDHLTCITGRIELAVYDPRSPKQPKETTTPEETTTTPKKVNTFILGTDAHKTIRIPQNVWHAYRVLGTHPATILNFPSTLYNYYDPDVEYLPPDTEEIPHEWA